MSYQTTNTGRAARSREGLDMRQIGRRVFAGAALLAVLAFGTGACNSLLEVSIPGRVPVDQLENPALAPTMVSAALGEFECAFAQYVSTTGILSGEYIISGLTIPSNIWGWRGQVEIKAATGNCPTTSNATGYGYYTPLQRARFLAEDGFKRIEAFADAAVSGKTDKLAQLAAYAGYSTLLLGEGFCEMSLDEGPRLTRAQVWAEAEDWFTKAIDLATTANNTAIKNMALVGRARARLNLGKTAEANTDASAVPAGFVRNAAYSTAEPRRENRVFNASITARDISVAAAYRNLTVGSPAVPDTRVRVVDAGLNGRDGVTRQWDQLKYTAKTSAIPIASYTQARLIMAEVQGGAQAVTILNALRTGASLPVLTPAEEADIPATIVEERRRWLFSEGARYQDMLRFGISFPSGLNHKNQTYGDLACGAGASVRQALPLPDVETLNNPNL
ncbi:MAG: RagB/SusD family nutrient uptake outer membrane protein [Gemmatimonadetes bacterium]|nr:RagB/SusD family nutrient uptake outer membrane protein [Gemmatimonadota bacterium]